jgi:MFS family permease
MNALGGLSAGRLLAAAPGFPTYAALSLLAGFLACLSFAAFVLIDDPGARAAAPPRPSVRVLLAHFAHSLRTANFRALLAGRLLATAGFCVVPLIAAYYAGPAGGGLANDRLVTYGAAMALGSAVGNLVLGRLGDRRGHRAGMLVAVGMQAVTLAIVLTTRGPLGCACAYFGAGICAAGSFVSHTNLLYETCPHDHRLAHMTVGNLVLGLGAAPAPFLAGWLATAVGLRMVFTVELVLSLAALAWCVTLLREPRAQGDRC